MEKVSIIVSAYNVRRYLGQCLETLRNQSYRNIEIVVIDDGSSDGTYDLGLEIARRDSRIVVIHQNHQGVSKARNNGIEHASGELITFVDGDDSVENLYIEHLVNQMHHFNSDIAVSFYKVYDENAKEFFVLMNPAPGDEKYNGVYSSEQWLQKIGPVLNAETDSVWGKLYKRSLFKYLRFPEKFSYFESGMTWWKACLGVSKISFLNQVDYTLRTNRKDLVKKPNDELQEAKEIVKSLEEQITMMNVLSLDASYLNNNLERSLNNLKDKSLAVSDYDYYQRATSALEIIRRKNE